MLAVAAVLVCLTVGTFCYYLLATNEESDPEMAARMERFILQPALASKAGPSQLTARAPLTGLAKKLAAKLEMRGVGKALDAQLDQAGITLKGSEFMLLRGALAFVGSWACWVLGRSELLLVGVGLGWLAPQLVLERRIRKRSQLLAGQLADALTLLSNSLKAGYSFLQALDTVSREMPPPIAQEFARTVKEISLGTDVDYALKALAKRANSEDLDLVITVVQIQRQIGGNLAEILDTIATTIRERIRIKGEIKTLTAQGRISGLVVSLLPVALGVFLYLTNPEYLSLLFVTTAGRYMLLFAVVSQLIGILLIKRIVNIEV